MPYRRKDNFFEQQLMGLKTELIKFNLALEKSARSAFTPHGNINKKKYPNLSRLYQKHQGLCDVLCNYLTIIKPANLEDLATVNNLIGNFTDKNGQFDTDKMERLSKTHILSIVGFIELLGFILFKRIPNNIFSFAEQYNLRSKDKGVNHTSLQNKLNALPIGICVKFVGYKTNFLGLPDTGHSMLISKIGENNYLFFNPDKETPQCEILDSNSLMPIINSQSKLYDQICFIDNDTFMQRVSKKVFNRDDELLSSDTPPRVGRIRTIEI